MATNFYYDELMTNCLPLTVSDSRALDALMRLIRLRDAANNEPLVSWCDWSVLYDKHCIAHQVGSLCVTIRTTAACPMAFKTNEIANNFFLEHKELLNIAKPLL